MVYAYPMDKSLLVFSELLRDLKHWGANNLTIPTILNNLEEILLTNPSIEESKRAFSVDGFSARNQDWAVIGYTKVEDCRYEFESG